MLDRELDKAIEASSFCIYGAGIVAASIYTAIKELYHKSPLFFLVSDFGGRGGTLGEDEKQPPELDGIAVKTLSAWREQLQSRARAGASDIPHPPDTDGAGIPGFYLIAVPEVHHQDIMDTLLTLGFPKIEASQVICVTNALENALMEEYYSSRQDCLTVQSLLSSVRMPETGDRKGIGSGHVESKDSQIAWHDRSRPSVQIFQVKSHKDKPLHFLLPYQRRANRGYLCPIQAGAALTTQVIAGIQDDMGENISVKNRNYCELTASYYVWKNSHADYKGICHYRRIFDLDEEQMQMLLAGEKAGDWDVILPYPSVYYPNLASEHSRYVSESDWQAMLRALEETAPDYYEAYKELVAVGERRFYNFNMLIAKAPVFDDYCAFLFRVLERTESYVTPKAHERADRFAGYLGENLTTLYFLKNRSDLKCAYAGKIWLT